MVRDTTRPITQPMRKTFGGKLAADLFESDEGINRVFVTSNVVIIGRVEGWSETTTDTATDVISEFFLYY